MTKSSQIILILVIVAISVVGYLFVFKTSTTAPNELPQTADYIPYTTQDFEKNKSKRRVLFFFANWCTTCRPVNEEFLESANHIPKDVVIFRVNYKDSDTDPDEKNLAEKYKITYQHTFVQVNQYGDVIKKWNGGNLADIIKNVN